MIGYGIRFKRWCKLRRCFPISQRDFRVDLIEEWWNKNIAFEGYYCGSILVSWQDVLRGWECEVWKVKSFLTFYDLCITSRHLQAFYHGTTWSVIQVTVIFPEIATRHTFAGSLITLLDFNRTWWDYKEYLQLALKRYTINIIGIEKEMTRVITLESWPCLIFQCVLY